MVNAIKVRDHRTDLGIFQSQAGTLNAGLGVGRLDAEGGPRTIMALKFDTSNNIFHYIYI